MMSPTTSLEKEIFSALGEVVDPELDEPITDLGFVRSVDIRDDGVTVHLRLPTSFCSPNFAYLMAADAQDALDALRGVGRVAVLLDDHHDSAKINAGLASRAGYRGTFGVEAEDSLNQLRETFKRKAHTAAMERSCTQVLRAGSTALADLDRLTLGDLPPGPATEALMRRRAEIGLPLDPACHVLVDDRGNPVDGADVPRQLRFARAVRISIDGNNHFCRGLLATRYADAEPEGMQTRVRDHRRTAVPTSDTPTATATGEPRAPREQDTRTPRRTA